MDSTPLLHNHRRIDGTLCRGEMIPFTNPTRLVLHSAISGRIVSSPYPELMLRCVECRLAGVPTAEALRIMARRVVSDRR